MQIQFKPEQSKSVLDFFNKRDFDFFIRPKLNMTRNGYLLTIIEGEENFEKLISLLNDNGIITD